MAKELGGRTITYMDLNMGIIGTARCDSNREFIDFILAAKDNDLAIFNIELDSDEPMI